MKTIENFTKYAALFVVTVLLINFASCKSDLSADTDQVSAYEPVQLMQRSDKITYGKEWDQVQNKYSEHVRAISTDVHDNKSKVLLAHLYIREARVTGEHGLYYPAALEVLDHAIQDNKIDNDMKFLALTTRAGVELSLHDFNKALETGTNAVVMNPANAQIHGVLVDANVELGNYERAVALADRMVSIKPDIRSYSRAAYLREIHGDVKGSLKAMNMAVKAGMPGYEDTAWSMLTLGDTYRLYGEPQKAKVVYESILVDRPNYPFAVGALGALAMEQGDMEEAEKILQRAMDIIPEVGFYVDMAKLYDKQGRTKERDALLEEIWTMLQDDVDSGHNMDMEYADIYLTVADDAEKALSYAKAEYNKRPENIDVNRLLARAYVATGDIEKAKSHLEKAKVTGSAHPELIEIANEIQKVNS